MMRRGRRSRRVETSGLRREYRTEEKNMGIPRRTKGSGSWTRPERFNLRLDVSTWARTNNLFARWKESTGLKDRCDIWEEHLLPALEKLSAGLPKPRKEANRGQQMVLPLNGMAEEGIAE